MTSVLALTGSREFASLIREVCRRKGWAFHQAFSREEMLALRETPVDILAMGWHAKRAEITSLASEATSQRFFPGSVAVLFDIHAYSLGKPPALSIGAVEYCQLPRNTRDWDKSTQEQVIDTLDRVVAEFSHYSQLEIHGVFEPNQHPGHPLFKNLVESSAICILATDVDGNITTMNLSGLTLFGYVAAELAGQPYRKLFSPQVPEADILDMYEVVMHTEGWEGEFEYRKRSGELFPGWTAVSRIWGPGGTFEGLVFTIRDITHEKELERENREMQEQILHSQKMESVGVLAGGIAHDFNNLLVGILGYSSKILVTMAPDDPLHESILQIESSAERAAQLTSSLLAFSRNRPRSLDPLNLNDTVRETVKLLRPSFSPLVEIEVSLADDLWAVEADASQMQQVLMNLCINARDAMPEGGKLIIGTDNRKLDPERGERSPGPRHGRLVTLSVSDSGVGIPEEHRDRIFDPFFTTKPVGSGTGLGLPVVYGIVSSHGGFVEVESVPCAGSTFIVSLPATERSAKPAVEEAPAGRGGNEGILLVDDEKTIRQLGTEILSSAGYNVRTAGDGVEALAVFQDHQEAIDLILLDLTMPKMGGEACLREIRRLDPEIPIVVSSGYNMDTEDGSIGIDGATDFLQKPYRAHQLISIVRKILDRTPEKTLMKLPE